MTRIRRIPGSLHLIFDPILSFPGFAAAVALFFVLYNLIEIAVPIRNRLLDWIWIFLTVPGY
jgi:hypothetical protein